jgi:hypothetical protein
LLFILLSINAFLSFCLLVHRSHYLREFFISMFARFHLGNNLVSTYVDIYPMTLENCVSICRCIDKGNRISNKMLAVCVVVQTVTSNHILKIMRNDCEDAIRAYGVGRSRSG